ncbi:MAG: glycine betaine/L-proline ABC transporter substrate-binding protein ProX [Trueperaceae bacterium]
MKLILAASVLLAALSGVAVAQDRAMPGDGATVEPGIDVSLSAFPIEAIFRILLEELGYDVGDPATLSNPIFYQGVAQGDIDYWANGWFPLHFAHLPDDFEEQASIVGTIVESGGIQGYLVSKAAAEEYDITSLDDFKRPEVKAAFDDNGDGKADLTACPTGTGCEIVIEYHLDVYDLRDHVNPIKANYTAAFADAVARYRSGEPVFFYTWTPNFTILELVPGEDVVWINVPEIIPTEDQEGLEDAMVVEGLEGAVTDPIQLGFVVNDISAVANNRFLEQNPAARRLFELIEVPLEDISDMSARISEGEDAPGQIESMAADWIAEHQEQVDDWLDEARSAD